MSLEQKPIGSFKPWLLFRLAQIVFTLFFLEFFSLIGGMDWRPVILGGLVVLLLSAWFHQLAHGSGTEQGLTIRRYFRNHFVPWSDVVSASFGPTFPMLVINVRRPVVFSKWIWMYPHSSKPLPLKDGVREALGLCTPEGVGWVRTRIAVAKSPEDTGRVAHSSGE